MNYKFIIVLISITLFISCLNAQTGSDTLNSPTFDKKYNHNISIDLIPVFYGSVIIRYEYRIIDRLSIEGQIGFGDFSFTEIKQYYSIGIRYYYNYDYSSGLFFNTYLNRTALKSEYKEDEVNYLYIGIGYRWKIYNRFTIDPILGLFMSTHDKTEFRKNSEGDGKTITIGGLQHSFKIVIGFYL